MARIIASWGQYINPQPCTTPTYTPTLTPTSTQTPTDTPTDTSSDTPTSTDTPISTDTSGSTLTFTPTPTPATIIVGHVTWQGIPQPDTRNSGISLTRSLCVSGVAHTYPSTTDAGGFFTATTGLPDGAYNWWVKSQINLAGAGTLTLTTGSANAEMGMMRAGDCNNDNVVGSQDFSTLKNTFGKSSGQPGYDGRADFNRDNVVIRPL